MYKVVVNKNILVLLLVFFGVAFLLSGCLVSNNPQRKQIKKLQKGIIKDDTSFIYHLPFEKDKKHLLVQGYFSKYSHKNRAALDFKMKRGTTICSARDGIVVRIKEDGNKGGWNKKYRSFGNVIIIEHADG
ncbi:MAG: hypothetical protein RIR31_11, partial [Bacteroidota bacterium]